MERELAASGGPPTLARVLDENEHQLDRLERQGVQLVVDGVALLQFFFDRVIANRTASDFRLNWALNVAGLLKEAETHALRSVAPS